MKEKELEILEQYDIDVKSTRKIRGAVLCDTKQGLFLLKESRFSEKQIPFLYEIQLYLKEQGYHNVDVIVKNRNDDFFSVSEEGTKYLLKKWFGGRECDSKKEIDILNGVKNLATLHQYMRKPFQMELRGREGLKEEFFRHNREMKKVRSFIRDKVGKGDFELSFLKYFNEMYEWAACASDRLNASKYDDLLAKSRERMTIAHGDYNYHNVLMLPSGVATTNFEHFYEGIQVADFYYFLRKTMEKNGWSVTLGSRMIEQYNRIKPFSKEELEYVAICLAYPEKFWKAANSYCRSRKAWIPAKSLEKLEMAICQMDEKKHFLRTVFEFYF